MPGTGKGDGSYAYGATDVTHTATSSDSDFNSVSVVLKATEGDDDVCSGTTAVGGATVTSGSLVEDCDTLLAAKAIVNGSGSSVNNWSTDLALNSWTGITVANSRVTEFKMEFFFYVSEDGNIPNTIADLDALTVLQMESVGVAPLPGPIPPGIENLTGLTRLTLYDIELTGQLPANIGNLTALTRLELDANQLSGTLPASMGNLTNLTRLFLDQNRFSGTIPAELGGLTGMTTGNFQLNSNQLTGCIPAGWSKYASKINPQKDASGNDVNLPVCTSLTATVDKFKKSVDLSIANHTGNWWFKINWWGSCTQVTGNSITGIGGYQVGAQHDVWAYSDSGCSNQIATTTFTITPHNAGLAAHVQGDRSVSLTLSNGPSNWWFRIGWGSCTPASGTTVSGIRGYKTGTYAVGAFAKSDCSGFLSDANFTIPPPTATLATTVNPGPLVNLTLTNGPSDWWFRINWWGTCTAVSGDTGGTGIGGYQPGTHAVWAYSDSSCNTEIASSSFTIPELVLSIAVDSSDRSVDLTLTGGPSNWWFKIGWWGTCTAASGTTVSNIRGYKSGSYLVVVYPAAGCAAGSHITAESFTMPSATLSTTFNSDRSMNLTLTNGPSNWWFRINSWGTCTAAPGNTVSGIAGYKPGTHPVSAYSDSGCNYHVASSSFTQVAPGDRDRGRDFNTLAAAGNPAPDGIWSDGTTMWVQDATDKKAYAYTLATKARDSGKDISFSHATFATAIAMGSDGTTMWVADVATTDKLFAYTISGNTRDASKDITLHTDNTDVSGLWANSTTIWVGDSVDDYIYAYTISGGARDSGKEITPHADNDNITGLWSDGTTMWVSDSTDVKLYAYTMSDGSRDSGKDYDLDSENGGAFDIWSDGTTMWVADFSDGKLYAYYAIK